MSEPKLNEMKRYNPEVDIPSTGWDDMWIKYHLSKGRNLFVDENGEVWTVDKIDYVGKITRQNMCNKNDNV